ncbi:MAG: DMT family transporter [Luminiphilus sp.]|nr:DMT family transporter [Luminiphilus sp.]
MKQSAHFPVLLAVLGVLLFSLLDAVMKAQALAMGTYSAMFWRMVFGVLFALLLFSPRRVGPISGRVLKIHMLRAAVTTLMTYLFFFSLTRIPLAQAIGLSFIAPIITLFLAAPLLGERIQNNAKVAAGLGFLGVIVVVGGEVLSLNADSDLLGLAALLLFALLYAFYLILQRKHSLMAQPMEIVFYQNIMVFLILLCGAPFFVSLPANAMQWGGAALAAVFAMGSLALMSMAYRRAEAQKLISIEYTAFIWAALLGWWFFAEGLTAQTLLGTSLIVAGCLASLRKS